jgi:hypothetical protein
MIPREAFDYVGCGHANLMERADESIRILVDFLEGRT